jgi:hypothetical protein
MIPPRSIYVVVLLVLIGTQYSCQRNGSGDFIRRLESAKEIEAEFQPAVSDLYTPGEKLPELAVILSKDANTFNLTATNRKDVDRIAPAFARILKRHGVKSANLILIGSEIMVEGRTVKTESSSYILGGFRIHADGTVEETPADVLMARATDAAQSRKQAD